jgi:ketosteroid isomerase-like protein
MAMTQPDQRAAIQAFLDAFATRDVERIAPFLDDEVTWTISGPVDLLHFCGVRKGKAAVLDVIGREVPAVLRIRRFAREMLLIDGDCAAALSRLSAVRQMDNRSISYRAAQFMRFRDGKLIEFSGVIDSFDAVEQVLGRPIDVHGAPHTEGDLVAV